MSFDTQFRKELKSMLSTSSVNHTSWSEKEVKHVSWVSIETDENKHKKQSRSTPFPRKKSTKDDITIQPTVLSFNDCFESLENVESKPKRRRKESTGEYSEFKKTLSKKALSSGLNSGWLETDVSSPLHLSDSDISNENIIVSEIDPSGQLAIEILKKIKDSNIYNDVSTDESVQNESLSFAEVDQIELFNGDCFDSGTSLNEDHLDSTSSDEEMFKVPKIVKNAKVFRKRCRIVEGSHILENFPNEKFNKNTKRFHEKNEKVMETQKLIPKNNNSTKISMSFKAENHEKIDVDSRNNQEESENEESDTSDVEFLLDQIEENLDVTKNVSFINTEPELNQSISEYIQFDLSKKHSVLFLNHSIKLYFCGKLLITVLSGAIEVFGHIFEANSKDIELYSPKGQSYLYISTLERKMNENIESLLSNYNVKVTAKNLENKCILLVKNLENGLIDCLSHHSPKLLFPKVSSKHDVRPLSLLEMRLQTYFEIEPNSWPTLEIEEDWNSFYNSLDFGKTISLMVCGGKGVGKSTFLKYVANRLLQNFERIVYIDLDPGQPEYTISGCISITIVDEPMLGPNYTHLRKPERCNFLGEINICHCFTHYINAVKDLISFYRKQIDPTIPCIINYMGFTKSLGTDLITSIIPIVCPNILVQIESDFKKHNFPVLLTPNFITRHTNTLPVEMKAPTLNYELKVLKSVTSRTDRSSVLEPKVLRNMCTVAYFSQALEKGNKAIASVTPYCASLSSINIQYSSETAENLLPVINGNLVALCTDSSNDCIGFGIVRGIDTTSDKIYIITPETREVMKKVKTLVMGVITLPSSFYTTESFHEGSNPYICRTIRRATTSIPKRAYRACQGLLKK